MNNTIESPKAVTLADALWNAACDLADNYAWTFDGETGRPVDRGGEFFVVMTRHVSPLLDVSAFVETRKAALRAELAQLECVGGSK